MLKTYFKIGWRNIRKNKLYSFINLTGLTVGITCCILIGLYISDEISYDRFHVNADRIVRVTMQYGSSGTINDVAQTGTKVGPQFKRTFPAVEDYVRTMKYARVVARNNKLFDEKNFLYADASFFKIFSFPLIKGDAANALNTTDKIVLTESAAKKYFGNEDAIGRTLRVGDSKDFIVSGIAKDVPGNSQIKFDFVTSFNNLNAAKTEQWWTANYVTYLLLHDKSQVNLLQQNITAYMQTDAVRKEAELKGNDFLTYYIQPLTKVHLYSSLEGFEPNGSITYVYILAIIGILILTIACVNYTNLATAQSAGRSAEIGIRKVMGAVKWQLFGQFIGESLLITFIAVVFALFISMQLLPLFNSITGKQLTASSLLQIQPLLSIILGGVIIGFLAGAYPALALSNTVITKILKAGFSFSTSGTGLRKSLIVFQFVISIFLIISTIIVLQQVKFIQQKDLGYDKERIIVLPVDSKMHVDNIYESLKKQITLVPGVSSVSGSYDLPTFIQWGDGINADDGTGKKSLSLNALPVDLDFIKTMGMKIVTGSDYTAADLKLLDTSDNGKNFHYTYMLNETAVKKLGWTPQQAIGKTIDKGVTGTVKAVVKDFHFASMHQPIGPLVLFLDRSEVFNMYIKVSGNNLPSMIQQLQSIWKERVPFRPFEYHFLDEDYNSLYKSEQTTAKVFTVFSALAILLACLGLFGLAAFTTVQRTKEIGIRKVLGASLGNIAAMLSSHFIKLVAISILIASPVAWWACNKWLQDFAYRIPVEWWVFILAGIIAITITVITVSYHALKAATANPAKSLRTE